MVSAPRERQEKYVSSLGQAAVNCRLVESHDGSEGMVRFVMVDAGHALSLAEPGLASTEHLFDAIYFTGARVWDEARFHFEQAGEEAMKEANPDDG